jgi:hypothetical protein
MEENGMKNSKVLTVLLAAGMAFSTPLIASAKKPPGRHESQKGGLPGLEDRVQADEALIQTLQNQVSALQGQSSFAVVGSDGTIVRSNSMPGPVTLAVPHTANSGIYEINFGKDVSACAYTATLGDTANAAPPVGEIAVSGDVDADNPNDVYVQTSDSTGAAADAPFHLTVTCP